MSKSLIEFAYEFVSSHEGSVNFTEIWNYVKEQSGLSEEDAAKKAGQFFTNMMLDGRFVTLGENEWDLRIRHKFEKVHIDMSEVYSDVETYDEDSEEEEEEAEYNSAFEDENKNKDDELGSESEEETEEEKEDNEF